MKTNIDSAAKLSTAGSTKPIVGALMGYARVPPGDQESDHQILDLAAAGIRRDGLFIDLSVSSVRADQPQLDCAIRALKEGDTLVITTLSSLGRSTPEVLTLAETLRVRGAALRVLDLAEFTDDAPTPGGNIVLTILAAVANMEFTIARERIQDSVFTRRPSSTRRVGRRKTFTEQQIRDALRLIESGEPPSQVARDLNMSRATLYRRINDIQQ